MIYVFDTTAFIALFASYYRRRFPTLWVNFDSMIAAGRIVSTREVRREIGGQTEGLFEWSKSDDAVFQTPTAEEGSFVAKIYQIVHFQQNIEAKKLLKGGFNADPFVVARASCLENGVVVTLEKDKPNAVRIPNICQHFGIACINLEQFMEAEKWEF